jgi:hypothetical protein
MAWNSYAPLGWNQYRSIVGNGPLQTPNAYVALIQAADKWGLDPRILLTQLQFENQFGRDISSSQLDNNNFAGIKFANQPGASAGGTSPEGDQYARFQTIGDFMNALGQSMSWYTGHFPDRLSYYEGLVRNYAPGADNSTPSASDLVNQGSPSASGILDEAKQSVTGVVSPFTAPFQWLSQPNSWVRILMGVVGVGCIVGGLLIAAGSNENVREAAEVAAVT